MTFAISDLVSALLICLKFHVSKYSVPWSAAIAMCMASSAQLGGIAFDAIKLTAIACASEDIATLGIDKISCIRCFAAIGSPTEISFSTNAEI